MPSPNALVLAVRLTGTFFVSIGVVLYVVPLLDSYNLYTRLPSV